MAGLDIMVGAVGNSGAGCYLLFSLGPGGGILSYPATAGSATDDSQSRSE